MLARLKRSLKCFQKSNIDTLENARMRNYVDAGIRRNNKIGPGIHLSPKGYGSSQDIRKTFVILGSYRGGTSMVAGILRLIGIYMGQDLGRKNNEDLEFQTFDVQRLKQTIAKRNEKHAVWGWKFPGSIDYIESIHQELVNPHYIFIFRDPVAIAQKEVFLDYYSAEHALSLSSTHQYKMMNFALKQNSPIYLASYERVLSNKEDFVVDMNEFTTSQCKEEYMEKISKYIIGGGGDTVRQFCEKKNLENIIQFEDSHGIKEHKGGVISV